MTFAWPSQASFTDGRSQDAKRNLKNPKASSLELM